VSAATVAARPSSGLALALLARPVLVVGLGAAGLRHAENARDLGARVILALRSGHGRRATPGWVVAETELERALERQPGLVIVANPTALHLPAAQRAVEAGAHVMVEKPVSHTLEGLRALRQAAVARGATVAVGYQLRFHPGLEQLRRWIADGAVGDVVSGHCHWGEHVADWHPGEDYRNSYSTRADLGGGALRTLSHPFDYLRFLLGEAESVSALSRESHDLGVGVEAVAHTTVHLRCGALVSVSLDYHERPRHHAVELTGTRGSLAWDERTGRAVRRNPRGAIVETVPPPTGFHRNDAFRAALWDLCVTAAERRAPRCTLDDGEAALRIVLAAELSAREGRRVLL
jgi:predicted dehydrogenase